MKLTLKGIDCDYLLIFHDFLLFICEKNLYNKSKSHDAQSVNNNIKIDISQRQAASWWQP